MQVWFDMDGTIADFYGVPTWREDLDNLSTRPYETARPLCKFCTLARLINALQNKGYSVGIISWSSMDAPPTFDRAVEGAKKEWLARHLPSVKFDRIDVVAYGTPKHEGREGILFDDNETVRADWEKSGNRAYDETKIFSVLRELLKE